MKENHGVASKRFRIYNAGSFGAVIKHYRTQEAMTQADLAERVGIPRNYLSALENGLETEHLDRLLKVLREFGLRVVVEKADW